ncbi:MAG: glycosyltransferase family 2 protein [Blastocatellia bacterium]
MGDINLGGGSNSAKASIGLFQRWRWRGAKYWRPLVNRLKGEDLTIHLYTHCWNEEKMLPFFFRHYDGIADQYFVFDTGSTDRSIEILQSHSLVQLTRIEPQGSSFVEENTSRQNEGWKQSRGVADWIIITAIDEHLYHPDLRGYLGRCRREGVTLIKAEGYEMVSDEFPRGRQPLYKRIKFGMRSAQWFDKIQAFDPNKIEEINYEPGRHEAHPTGEVSMPALTDVKLLHYKFLGLNYVVPRYLQLRTGLRPKDIEMSWGSQYLWDSEKIVAQYEEIRRNAVPVI